MQQNLEARVLAVGFEGSTLNYLMETLNHRFSGGNIPSLRYIPNGDQINVKVGPVEYTIVENVRDASNEIAATTPPHYSLVAYHARNINPEGDIGHISEIRKRDFFLPQIVLGSKIEPDLAGRCARAGVLYFASDMSSLKYQLENIFRAPRTIRNSTMFKIGGSALDFDRQVSGSLNLEYVCDQLIAIRSDRPISKGQAVNRVIVNVGAGQHGDPVKDFRAKYAHKHRVQRGYPKSMALALQQNLESLKALFGDQAALISTGAFYYIGKSSTSKKIPLIGTAPHYIMARDGIPMQDSDTHTVALAEFYGLPRVVLVKRTDGIYKFDPYRGFELDPTTGRCKDYDKWRKQQEGNELYSTLSVADLLKGTISRTGTGIDGNNDGTVGHLMEDSALRYTQGCKFLKEVLVVHIAPEEMHYQVAEDRFRHVVTGQELTLDPQLGWKGLLEKNVLDAYRGEAISRIVVNN